MLILQSGVEISVIALWLCHESISTTNMYTEADLKLKEKALKTLRKPEIKNLRYHPSDSVLSFLDTL